MEESLGVGPSASVRQARHTSSGPDGEVLETPSLSKHNGKVSPGPPPALTRKMVAGVTKMASSAGDTPGTTFNPLAGVKDCYAAQLALRGGIKQTIQHSWTEYNLATKQLAERRLLEEKAHVDGMVAKKHSAALKRPFIPLQRHALTQEEIDKDEPGKPIRKDNGSGDGKEQSNGWRGGNRGGGSGTAHTMVRFTMDERKGIKRLRATKMSQSGDQAGVGAPGLPLYMTWTYVNRNVTTKEEGRQMFYTDDTGETVPASDSDEESPDFIGSYIGKTREEEEAVRGVMQRFGCSSTVVKELSVQLQTKAEDIRQIEKEVFREQGHARTDRFSCCLERVNNCFCRRCYIYGCKLHECGQQFPNRSLSPPLPMDEENSTEPCGPDCWRVAGPPNRKVPDTGTEAREWAPGQENGENGAQRPADNDGWAAMEDDLIETGIQLFGLSRPCDIARLVGGRTCAEVKQRLRRYQPAAGQAEEGALEGTGNAQDQGGATAIGQDSEGGAGNGLARNSAAAAAAAATVGVNRGRLKRHASAKKKKSQPRHVVMKRLQHDTDHAWPEYTPCNCEGPCDEKTCPCAQAGNFCEKFCGCAKDCNLRFRGCSCKSQCRHRACPCLAAGRECDPDLCKHCAPTCSGEAAPGKECCNMRVRLRQHARIVMGLSSVAGWGAFLQHAVKKNDFLGEYTGEIISQDEADRRGKVYDRVDNSYLFNLNEQSVLDARQFGNKLRFINHSKTNANCYAVILLVDGDHRVGIFAKQDIQPGVELFYDYRYDSDRGPKWAQKH